MRGGRAEPVEIEMVNGLGTLPSMLMAMASKEALWWWSEGMRFAC